MKLISRLSLLALLSCSTAPAPFAGPPPVPPPADGPPPSAPVVLAEAPGTAPTKTAGPVAALPSDATFDHDHARWSKILSTHVVGDGFAYGRLAKAPDALYAYLDELHGVAPDELASWTKDQRFAFWINAYNAHTIQKVIENYPLKSIRKLDKSFGLNTVFDQAWIPMNAFHPKGKDKPISLNHIEHDILRANFPDARLHAAINCASESCPPLRNEAFVAARLDEQLQEQMEGFVRDASRNALDREKNTLRLSEIFKWFKGDFERDAGSVREYLVRFAPEADAEFLRNAKLRYLDYSWKLNDVR